jgi:hypothetical protein
VSSIREVKPVDWERPRRIDVVYDSRDGITETSVEFDTIEAARDWRNEFSGACHYLLFDYLVRRGSPGVLFMYHRNRRAVLARDSTEDVNGIRINIPLSRVAGATKSQCLSFACMVSITISADPFAFNESLPSPFSDSENDTSSVGASIERSETLSTESDAEPYAVQVSIIRKDPIWDDFMSYVDKAKAATAGDTTEWPGSRVYIDYDPRNDLGQELDSTAPISLQTSVARALGLDTTKEFFCEWRLSLSKTCV